MIVITGSKSKKFGDIYYTFVIFITNISDYNIERLITRLGGDNYPLYFFITCIFNCFLHFICVYVLIGSRIQLLIINPDLTNKISKKDSNDLRKYVTLYKRRTRFSFFYKKFKRFSKDTTQINVFNIKVESKKEDYSFRESVTTVNQSII